MWIPPRSERSRAAWDGRKLPRLERNERVESAESAGVRSSPLESAAVAGSRFAISTRFEDFIPDLYAYAGIDADHIVEAAILALDLETH